MDPLDQLENKSIYLIREAYARFHGSLAMLWSMGKDSTALLWLVRKALVGFNKAIYDEIVAEMAELLSQVGIAQFTCVPVSAFYGINVVKKSAEMAWYTGPTLLEALDTLRFKPFPCVHCVFRSRMCMIWTMARFWLGGSSAALAIGVSAQAWAISPRRYGIFTQVWDGFPPVHGATGRRKKRILLGSRNRCHGLGESYQWNSNHRIKGCPKC